MAISNLVTMIVNIAFVCIVYITIYNELTNFNNYLEELKKELLKIQLHRLKDECVYDHLDNLKNELLKILNNV